MSFKSILSSTFTVGETQTPAIILNEMTPVGLIITGSVITGTSMTFLASVDGTNYYPLYNSASLEVTITTGSYARIYSLAPEDFLPCIYMKARLGTSASAVAQARYDQPIVIITESFK